MGQRPLTPLGAAIAALSFWLHVADGLGLPVNKSACRSPRRWLLPIAAGQFSRPIATVPCIPRITRSVASYTRACHDADSRVFITVGKISAGKRWDYGRSRSRSRSCRVRSGERNGRARKARFASRAKRVWPVFTVIAREAVKLQSAL